MPLSAEQHALLQQLSASLSPTQLAWLGGYLAGAAGLSAGQSGAIPAVAAGPELTILYATQTGNAHRVGQQLASAAEAQGFQVTLKDCANYKVKQLKKQRFVFIVAATYGEGDPPDSAMEFHEFLMGDRAAKMPDTKFSVLSLGDSSYEHFCKIGVDFDERLEALGAERLVPRVDCDLDYDDLADQWVADVMAKLAEFAEPVAATAAAMPSIGVGESKYDKRNPFHAELSERILLNGRGSDKETYHIELSLEGSGLTYQPGDSVGIIPCNAAPVVDSLLDALGFDGAHALGDKSLREALLHDYEVTILTRVNIDKYNTFAESGALAALVDVKNRAGLKEYSDGREIIDLITDYPVSGLTPEEFVGILRKLSPRLYSIASSQALVDEEVHLTSATVRFHSHGRDRMGVATTYMADRVAVGETIPLYLHSNPNFHMPADSDTPIIMIGPGTGIAPFRAFVQEREATGASGKNWLFFGDQHFTTDFLYQTEWLQYLKDGLLTRLDVAFSRDQAHKVYVQHRMVERAKELYAWLQEGASFYVCGDESRMAPDVHEALIGIVETQGAMSREAAEEYVKTMQREKRYQRDVY